MSYIDQSSNSNVDTWNVLQFSFTALITRRTVWSSGILENFGYDQYSAYYQHL